MVETKTGKQFTKKDFLNDLYLFYRYFIASNYVNSVPAPHIKTLSRKLMELHNGTGKHRLAVSMPPRHPLDINTPVFTINRGWIKHGDLCVGDIVLNKKYKKTEVVNVLPRVSVDNCFVFSNGDKIVSGDEHLWYFNDYENNVSRLFTTREIMERKLRIGKSYLSNFKIISPTKTISLIDAYKVEERQGNCITVKARDGMYLVGENFTPTHNSKSSMVTLAFPLWLLFQNPNVNIMIVTGSPKLAEKFGIQLREYVRELGKYFNVYLSSVKQASTHIMFCDKDNKLYKGNIMLASSGGGITGQDADYLILDDPYTGNDSEFTPSALQQKIDWVNRVVEQRIEPHTKYCILHTRWHSLDLIGYYKESDPDAYDFIEFPAINEKGEALWSERYTVEELLKKKETVGERVFQSIYQQQPIDMTSDYFNMGMLKFGLPEDYDGNYTTRCRAWDIASGNQLSKSDFTAGIYMIRYNDYAIIQDLVHGRFGNKNKQIIVNVAEQDTPNVHIVIETGVGAGAKLLFQEWQTQLMGYMVTEAQVSGGKSKVDRATPLQNAIEDGKVYVNIQDPVIRQTFYDELSSFPNGSHDDITDATAHAFNFLFVDNIGKPRPRPKIGAVFL